MTKLFEIASKVSNQWSLAAFAISALVFLILKLRRKRVPAVVWGVIVSVMLLALTPIVAPMYMNSYGIYRVRVIVLDEGKMPTNDAKVVCSLGGEVKKIEGGWECDIPSKTRPTDGKMQVYATVQNAFLSGSVELELKDDYSPVATITLGRDTSAKVMGMVVDHNHESTPQSESPPSPTTKGNCSPIITGGSVSGVDLNCSSSQNSSPSPRHQRKAQP